MPITKDLDGKIVYTDKEDLWDSDKTGVFAENDIAISNRGQPTKQLQFQVASTNQSDAVVTLKVYADADKTIDLTNGIGAPGYGVTALTFNNLTQFQNFALPFTPVNSVAFVNGDKLFYNGEDPDGMGGSIPGSYVYSGVYVFTDNGNSTGSLARAPGWEAGAFIPKGTLIHIGAAGSDDTFMRKNMDIFLKNDFTVGSGDPFSSGSGLWSPRPFRVNKTLSAQDITNQYVNLAQFANEETIDIALVRDVLMFGVDYTVSAVNGVTRVTFAGDYASGGATPLVAGNILRLKFFV